MMQIKMLRPERWVCSQGRTSGPVTVGWPGSSTRPHLTCLPPTVLACPTLESKKRTGGLTCLWLYMSHAKGSDGGVVGRWWHLPILPSLTRTLGHCLVLPQCWLDTNHSVVCRNVWNISLHFYKLVFKLSGLKKLTVWTQSAQKTQ